MKILRVAGDLYPAVIGGVGIHVHELSKWQVKYGHEVTVFTNNQKKLPRKESIDGYKIRRFPVRLTLFGNSISPDLIPAIFQSRKKFDIIHAHSHLFFPTNVCSASRLLGSVPLILTNHGLTSASAPDWLNTIYTHSVARITFSTADCILCYTDIERNNLEKLGVPGNKIRVIHNGVDTDLFSPHKIETGKKVQQLLWVGRFVPGKGVNFLIDAFYKIVKKFPDTRLVLVGEGPQKGSINTQIEKLGIRNNVEIYDYCDNSRLPDLFNQSDIFILPSLMEGVPRTMLEAMACGIPVIVTELPHLKKIVGGAGLFISRGDSEMLSESIIQLLNDNKMASYLGEKGRMKILKDFSWRDTVEQTLNVYKEFI
jgi:glycosyltransferase involved in cell wall biosynthesis